MSLILLYSKSVLYIEVPDKVTLFFLKNCHEITCMLNTCRLFIYLQTITKKMMPRDDGVRIVLFQDISWHFSLANFLTKDFSPQFKVTFQHSGTRNFIPGHLQGAHGCFPPHSPKCFKIFLPQKCFYVLHFHINAKPFNSFIRHWHILQTSKAWSNLYLMLQTGHKFQFPVTICDWTWSKSRVD